MFEDSTFESTGRIHTRSRGWMLAASAFNGSILLALVLIPLMYPEALPRIATIFLMEAPPMQQTPPTPPMRVEHVNLEPTQMPGGQIFAPRTIPPIAYIPDRQETLPDVNVATMDDVNGPAPNDPFRSQNQRPVIRQQVRGPVRISGMVVEGLLIRKTMPVYPPIAKASGTQGTVVLQATISKSGTIENLRVASGHQLLQQAALDAVRNWRYRPYMLNGDPVEVETTVNVVFKLQN
jgi:periplasmic protein TonB